MRPHKHVAELADSPSQGRFEDVRGIDLAKFAAPWGPVPFVASTERDRITLYYWNDLESRWVAIPIDHQPLDGGAETPDGPASWNWSDRVAVACSATTVHVLYKRGLGSAGTPPALVLDRYRPRDPSPGSVEHGFERIDSTVLARVEPGEREVGRTLWATCNEPGQLIALYQERSAEPAGTMGEWRLQLLRVDPGSGSEAPEPIADAIAVGGFDLDARLHGPRLTIVHRETSAAFRVAVPSLFEGLQLTSGPEADEHYVPLKLLTLDLGSMSAQTEELPGGEHPQLQSLEPLIVTFDRHKTIQLSLNQWPLPLPPAKPHVSWHQGQTEKVAFVRMGDESYRGTLLTGYLRTIPHSHADMSAATLLFDIDGVDFVNASPFASFPVSLLAIEAEERRLTVDLLHQRFGIGLFRTRQELALANGEISISESSFEVWDMGHGWIFSADMWAPSTEAESAQFDPRGELPVTTSPLAAVKGMWSDVSMGGHLTTDVVGDPASFFAYTDLGDGGLRVIFSGEPVELPAPPTSTTDKELRPEQVTGPHLACDQWIELPVDGWAPAEVPGYFTGTLFARRSVGSGLEVPLDFLLDGARIITESGAAPAALLPLEPSNGLSVPQLTALDAFRAGFSTPPARTISLDDGRQVVLAMPASALVAGLTLGFTIQAAGNPAGLSWTVLRVNGLGLADAPVPIDSTEDGLTTGTGSAIDIVFPRDGRWRVSVFVPGITQNAPIGAGYVDLEVSPSTYAMLTGLYTGIADGEWHQIGNLVASLPNADIGYSVPGMGAPPSSISITSLHPRDTELSFRGSGVQQGRVGFRHVISFRSSQLALKKGLGLVFQLDSLAVTLRYGREFTPGMLMEDSRSLGIVNGQPLGDDRSQLVDRDDVTAHAAIGAKPFGNGELYEHEVKIEASMTVGAIVVTALIAALTLIGAASVVASIALLLGAIAAAAILGPVGLVVALLLTAVLTYFIATQAPQALAAFAEEQVRAILSSPEQLALLNAEPLIRYGGEAASEAIARMALAKAKEMGFDVPVPAGIEEDGSGRDRTRGQLFQMVVASEGLCRVLMRMDTCDPTGNPAPPGPLDPAEDDPDPGGLDPTDPPIGPGAG